MWIIKKYNELEDDVYYWRELESYSFAGNPHNYIIIHKHFLNKEAGVSHKDTDFCDRDHIYFSNINITIENLWKL